MADVFTELCPSTKFSFPKTPLIRSQTRPFPRHFTVLWFFFWFFSYADDFNSLNTLSFPFLSSFFKSQWRSISKDILLPYPTPFLLFCVSSDQASIVRVILSDFMTLSSVRLTITNQTLPFLLVSSFFPSIKPQFFDAHERSWSILLAHP